MQNRAVACLPELSMPDPEAEVLWTSYRDANVILEYGSGGSTVLAATLPGKLVVTVESDLDWLLDLRATIEPISLPSLPIFYHTDIGPTGAWGRPMNTEHWGKFHTYPLRIWDEPWFPHPDVVLIDGRFRTACLATVLLRATKHVRVLFDDYINRPAYHSVERHIKPSMIVGRLAIFEIDPQNHPKTVTDFIYLFSQATYSESEERYE